MQRGAVVEHLPECRMFRLVFLELCNRGIVVICSLREAFGGLAHRTKPIARHRRFVPVARRIEDRQRTEVQLLCLVELAHAFEQRRQRRRVRRDPVVVDGIELLAHCEATRRVGNAFVEEVARVGEAADVVQNVAISSGEGRRGVRSARSRSAVVAVGFVEEPGELAGDTELVEQRGHLERVNVALLVDEGEFGTQEADRVAVRACVDRSLGA